jgi:hypothetical protein
MPSLMPNDESFDASSKRNSLIGADDNLMVSLQKETQMHAALRAILAIPTLAALAPLAFAQPAVLADPDWPCHQIKVTTFPLAGIWSGPELDLNSENWRNESDIADLTAKMVQRRVPTSDLESAIVDFKAKAGEDPDAKLLHAFAAAFEELSQQRSQILDGLERFGRKQRAMADRIRVESEAIPKPADENRAGQTPPSLDSQRQLEWDIRIFDDRRRMVPYMCEAPELIERRIGVVARAVQEAL